MRFLLLIPFALLGACGEETTVPAQRDPLAERNADQIIEGLEHTMTSSGVRTAVLHGDTAFFRDTDSRVQLKGVRLTFYNESGVESGRLTSREGEYEMVSGSMVAEGDAVLVIQGPTGERRIESETLHFERDANRIWSDKPTVMREGARVVRGTRFESDTKFQNVTVHSANVSGPAPSGGGGEVRF